MIFFPKDIAVLISSKNQSSSICSFALKQSLVTKRTTQFDEAIALLILSSKSSGPILCLSKKISSKE